MITPTPNLDWFLPSDLPGNIESAREIKLRTGIALRIMGVLMLHYHPKSTVHDINHSS